MITHIITGAFLGSMALVMLELAMRLPHEPSAQQAAAILGAVIGVGLGYAKWKHGETH